MNVQFRDAIRARQVADGLGQCANDVINWVYDAGARVHVDEHEARLVHGAVQIRPAAPLVYSTRRPIE